MPPAAPFGQVLGGLQRGEVGLGQMLSGTLGVGIVLRTYAEGRLKWIICAELPYHSPLLPLFPHSLIALFTPPHFPTQTGGEGGPSKAEFCPGFTRRRGVVQDCVTKRSGNAGSRKGKPVIQGAHRGKKEKWRKKARAGHNLSLKSPSQQRNVHIWKGTLVKKEH